MILFLWNLPISSVLSLGKQKTGCFHKEFLEAKMFGGMKSVSLRADETLRSDWAESKWSKLKERRWFLDMWGTGRSVRGGGNWGMILLWAHGGYLLFCFLFFSGNTIFLGRAEAFCTQLSNLFKCTREKCRSQNQGDNDQESPRRPRVDQGRVGDPVKVIKYWKKVCPCVCLKNPRRMWNFHLP